MAERNLNMPLKKISQPIKKILLVTMCIQIIWLIMFVVDAAMFFTLSRTVFAITLSGGEVVQHIGFGYVFNQYFPLTDISNPSETSSYTIHPYVFIFAQLFLLTINIVITLYISKKKKASLL